MAVVRTRDDGDTDPVAPFDHPPQKRIPDLGKKKVNEVLSRMSMYDRSLDHGWVVDYDLTLATCPPRGPQREDAGGVIDGWISVAYDLESKGSGSETEPVRAGMIYRYHGPRETDEPRDILREVTPQALTAIARLQASVFRLGLEAGVRVTTEDLPTSVEVERLS